MIMFSIDAFVLLMHIVIYNYSKGTSFKHTCYHFEILYKILVRDVVLR